MISHENLKLAESIVGTEGLQNFDLIDAKTGQTLFPTYEKIYHTYDITNPVSKFDNWIDSKTGLEETYGDHNILKTELDLNGYIGISLLNRIGFLFREGYKNTNTTHALRKLVGGLEQVNKSFVQQLQRGFREEEYLREFNEKGLDAQLLD